ncbi:MAG: beta-galactosidase trimerization domain-containing protein, partial [Armatimonadetes bacterium]|nr:beta-galactosidase trimerization domain-containing protein [Armatimonadota bacterium]
GIIRSFSPDNALPQVTTHFHSDQRGTANDIWQSWYYFAHGNRGMIGWVEGWFDGATPRPWLAEYRDTLKELGGVQGSKQVGAKWLHDGVAIYYSHPSIQVSWCLDIEPHGRTWGNRNGSDHRLGTSHLVRRAWEDLLTDSGLQYNFVAYDQVATAGVPEEYKVLILPACYALSDLEAERITEFCRRGGTVIADFGCGVFDQHGTGRKSGALDELFGVRHDGTETKADWFSGKLWVEADQDAGYAPASWRALLDTLSCPQQDGFAVAEHRLPVRTVRQVGQGTAVCLNLSPQRYLQYREEGAATDAHRQVFVGPVLAAVKPWVKVVSGGRPWPNAEVTYWTKDGRTLLFVMQKVATGGDPAGGNWAEKVVDQPVSVTVELDHPVRDAVDERTGKRLGDGRSFGLRFRSVEAGMLSFTPPAPAL